MMTIDTRINYKLTMFLLTCCAVAAIVLIIEWQYAIYARQELFLSLDKIEKNSEGLEDLPVINLTKRPMDSYAELVNRPLFFEGRKPIDDQDSGPVVEAFRGKMELVLTGVVETPDGMIAMMQDKDKQHFQLNLHDDVEGWEVHKIDADKVVMKRGNKQTELMLRKPKEKVATPPERTKFKIPDKIKNQIKKTKTAAPINKSTNR